MHLKRKIKELIKAGKLSHLIKELKQGVRKGQSFGNPNGPTLAKGSQAKGYTKLLSRSRNLVPTLKDEDETKGPMIIEAEIGGHFIHHMYVDGGSASEILYEHCFSRLCPEVKNQMVPAIAPLISFSGEIIWPIGQISLSVKIGDTEHSTSTWMNFVVVRSPSPYNGIIRRPEVRKIQAVPSTAHKMLKFPVLGGILTLRSIKIIPLDCTMVSGPEAQPSANIRVAVERIKVAMHPEYPEQTVAIADMTGVPRNIAEHRLNVREGCHPVRQKKRSQAPERNKAVQKESNLPTFGRQSITEVNWQKLGGIHGRSSNQEPHKTRNNKGHRRNIHDPKENKHEAKSQEMHLRGGRRHVPGIHGKHQRDKSDLATNVKKLIEDICRVQSEMVMDATNVELRAKVTWLSVGDFNTKFFHNVMKEKRNRNRIENVEDLEGNFFSIKDVGEQFVKHFEKVLDRRVEVYHINDPSRLFNNKLSLLDADSMVRPISNEEIKDVVFSMEDDKASKPDGYSSKFFKASWSIVGPEFTKAIQDFFSNLAFKIDINCVEVVDHGVWKWPPELSDKFLFLTYLPLPLLFQDTKDRWCLGISKVWNYFKSLMKLDDAPSDMYQVIDYIVDRPLGKSIWSIIQGLVIGAAVYFL
ncbi:hypothetical protein Tco_1053359 [Tanacetum coccineum]